MTDAYTIAMYDLLIASALAFVIVVFYVWAAWHTHRVLGDPDHPDHEDAKEALAEQHRHGYLDEFRFP